MRGRNALLISLLVVFLVLSFQTKTVFGTAAESFNGILGLIKDGIEALGPKDYLTKKQKDGIALQYWNDGKKRLSFEKPLEPIDMYGQGMVFPYECSFQGQESVVAVLTVWINNTAYIQNAPTMLRTKYYELIKDKETFKKIIAANFPQIYTIPGQQPAQTAPPEPAKQPAQATPPEPAKQPAQAAPPEPTKPIAEAK